MPVPNNAIQVQPYEIKIGDKIYCEGWSGVPSRILVMVEKREKGFGATEEGRTFFYDFQIRDVHTYYRLEDFVVYEEPVGPFLPEHITLALDIFG